ncbi:MAG: GNAT family N-acetyltransferase [Gemmatimonadota bacterium]
MTQSPAIRLVRVTDAVALSAHDPAALEGHCNASVDGVADMIAAVIEQGEAHRGRTGAPREWGAFLAVDDAERAVIGTCAYVNAPDAHGAVEIAYFTFPQYERRGYGGAMAGALLADAAATGAVKLVYAHTLPEINASTRILARHGFAQTGTAHDEEAGEVWRWERAVDGQVKQP